MTNLVVATAGHVDHGKSTLVTALTGTDPDRLAEEKRRGLTIELGFAHLTLDSGRVVSFVDVPGHERFIGNMLAGLGPASVVMFVVAADEGWSAQSGDHRDAVRALGITAVIPVITKIDAASPEQLTRTNRQLRAELGSLWSPPVEVSARTGAGLDRLKDTLEQVEATRNDFAPTAPLRIWIDRAFSIAGAGTVVTGTLGEGSVRVGDDLGLVAGAGHPGGWEPVNVKVKGLQTHGQHVAEVAAATRVALNVRGVGVSDVSRGDVLIEPGAWHIAHVVDVGRTTGVALSELPRDVTVHVGSASLSAHVRPLSEDFARFTLSRAVPVRIHDRMVLRGTGERTVLGGVEVLDYDPPALTRRGAAAARAESLANYDTFSYRQFVDARGIVRRCDMEKFGFALKDAQMRNVFGLIEMDGWVLGSGTAARWTARARQLLEADARDPLSRGIPVRDFEHTVGMPRGAVDYVVQAVGAEVAAGFVRVPGPRGLGPAEPGVQELERRLRARPFAAPEASDLVALGLGVRELAAAEDLGRVVRLGSPGELVVLLPDAPARAMRVLAGLPQPFTLSEARQALGTTRRVAVPLLEHTDARGWTVRVDASHRIVASARSRKI